MARQRAGPGRTNARKRRTTVVTGASLCLAVAASSVFAQKIGGRVQLPDSSAATQLSVTVVDSAGKTLSRVATNDVGRYVIDWLPGASRLTLTRIGARP